METISSDGLVKQVFLRCVQDCYEPIMLTDRLGKLTYVNPAWVKTYGYAKEEAIGQTPRILRSPFQDDEFYQAMWRNILNPKIGSWRGEIVNRAKDGHYVPVLLTITPYRNQQQEIDGYMGMAVDLTEQKNMEQQILRQDRLASIGMLAGGLAHEIGNPLGTIRGRAELLQIQVHGKTDAEKNLAIIIAQIDRISGLLRSLLRVSRVPEQILLGEVHLQSAVEEVSLLMVEACRRAGIQLLCKNLDYVISADPSHIHQVLLNLIINSMHAIEEQKSKTSDKVEHWIEVSAQNSRDGRCLLVVRDSGCGISKEVLGQLFHPFFTTKAPGKGTGLGLAIVSKLVEEMGGSVSAHSPGVGHGASFHLDFKLLRAAVSPSPTQPMDFSL